MSWFLLVGHRLLDGAVLGLDVIEINPPLFAYLSIPLAWVSEQVGGRDALALRLMTSLTVVVILGVTWKALRAGWPDSLTMPLTIVGTITLFVLPGEQFGQREHFILAGMLPYAVVAALRVRRVRVSWGLAVLAGVLMAAAVAIKPFFGLAWLGLEGWLLRRGAGWIWRRPESLLTVVGVLVYAALIPVLFPFYTYWLRLLASTYWSYHHISFSSALLTPPWAPLVIVSCCLAALSRGNPLGTSLAIVGAGSLGAAVLQAKGWPNHYLPAAGLMLLLIVLLATQQDQGGRVHLQRYTARLVGGVASLVVVIRTLLLFPGGPPEGESVPELRRWLQQHTHTRDRIAVLTGVPFTPVRLASSTGTVLATRFQNLWPLASLRARTHTAGTPLEAESTVERVVFTATVSDIVRQQPRVIAIRPRGGELPSVDLIDYFMQSPRFYRVIASYDYVGVLNHYAVWRRRAEE